MKLVDAPTTVTTPHRILVPLEDSQLSKAALPLAIQLAEALGSELAVLAVLRGTHSDDEVAEEDTRAWLVDVARSHGLAKEPIVDVLRGDPAEEIVWSSQSRNAGLIVMATHARSGLMRGLLGSVTDRVIHSSRVPVLVVRPDEQAATGSEGGTLEPIQSIIVGLDGSELAERSIELLVPIAEALGARLRLAQVLKPRVGESPADLPSDPEYIEAKRYMEWVTANVNERGVAAEWVIKEGYVDEQLVRLADETPGSIIALSTRGLSGLQRWTVGSVTDKVTRSSTRPVLVIPPKLTADTSAWAPKRTRPA